MLRCVGSTSSTASSPDVAQLVDAARAAGVAVVVLDCTVDTRRAHLHRLPLRPPATRRMGLYHGYGTHLDPQVALIRAICEAAQGRLVFIAGSRDDSFGHHRRFRATYDEAQRHAAGRSRRASTCATSADESGNTFEADGRTLLAPTASHRASPRVLAVDLDRTRRSASTCSASSPRGSEGYMLEDFTPGPTGPGLGARGHP